MGPFWSAGRPIIQMSVQVRSAWRIDYNGGKSADDVGRCSELQAFFNLTCSPGFEHLTYRTPKDITDKEKKQLGMGLRCRQCSHNRGALQPKPVSKHEALAWQAVSDNFRAPMLVEIWVLGKNWGAADIWLPWLENGQQLDMILMIDGEKHFAKGWGNVDVAAQQAIDHRFNEECWKQDHKLLRLYSDDKEEWGLLISQALRQAVHEPLQKFQLFSSQYGARTSEVNRQACMSFSHKRTTGTFFQSQ